MNDDFIKILVIDDTFTNRFLLREVIKKNNFNYFEAENGKEGIELLRKEKPSLILLDIEMPVMNGFETLDYIRNQMEAPFNTIPIIAITAHNPEIFRDDFKDYIFDDLLTKPFTMEKIMSLIHKYLPNS